MSEFSEFRALLLTALPEDRRLATDCLEAVGIQVQDCSSFLQLQNEAKKGAALALLSGDVVEREQLIELGGHRLAELVEGDFQRVTHRRGEIGDDADAFPVGLGHRVDGPHDRDCELQVGMDAEALAPPSLRTALRGGAHRSQPADDVFFQVQVGSDDGELLHRKAPVGKGVDIGLGAGVVKVLGEY